MEYVRTGIEDLDGFFAGKGYPKGNTILALGGPGSGKSIFAMQYIYNGARLYNEPGIYVTLEESPEKLEKNIAAFGWDLKKLIEDGLLLMIDATTPRVESTDEEVLRYGLSVENLIKNIEANVKAIKAKRLVIDSLSVMGFYGKDEFEVRTEMIKLSVSLSNLGVTSLVISEARTNDIGLREFPLETFMFDGVIWLMLDTATQDRLIAIRKMRGTKHVLGTFKFVIGDSGIRIKA